MDKSFLDRFWEKVDVKGKDDCWEWKAGRFAKTGYGMFWTGIDDAGAHRVSWEISRGKIPDGLFVCHKCDNPPCVNPNHLFLGTNSDNMRDLWNKGKGNRVRTNNGNYLHGEMSRHAKLTQEKVDRIRKVYSEKLMTTDMLAKEYSVTRKAIKDVIANRTWKSNQYVVPERWGIHNPIMRGKHNEQ